MSRPDSADSDGVDTPAGQTEAAPDPRPGRWARLKAAFGRAARFLFRRPLCFGGLAGALVFLCLSLTPSLLPRGWIMQGVVSGITAAIGYGLGSALSAILRRLLPGEPSPGTKRVAWRVLLVTAVLLIPLFLFLSAQWQETVRRLMEADQPAPTQWLLLALVTALIAGLLLVVSRTIRGGARVSIRFFERFVPRPISTVIGGVVTVLLVLGVLQGFLLDPLLDAANSSFSLVDKSTTEGIEQPTSTLRSGGPESLIPWDTLGVKGRDFTGGGPTVEDLEAFHDGPVTEPIRAYVGLRSAPSLEERVQLGIEELERTGAFDRDVLAVITTTGTGWVDENVSDSLEYLHAGDTAQIALQYSYLPSWISFLVDITKAEDAGRALVTAITEYVDELPEDDRPEVLLFGESLGSHGTESAFEDADDLLAGSDGAMLVGPTFVNPIHEDLTDERDEGSPEWQPVVEDGEDVRFAQEPPDLEEPEGVWGDPRVVYLQNASDPITWFSPDLLLESPGWLDDPRGTDVSDDMFWMPVVTFWQVAADLAVAGNVPAGHGHRYGANVVDGWVALYAPDGWTEADTDALRELIAVENEIRTSE